MFGHEPRPHLSGMCPLHRLNHQAAAKEPFGVTLGAIIGHGICTGIAVIGGKLLASRISERMTLVAGGVLFILFALAALVQGPASY